MFPSFYDAISYVFSSYAKAKPFRQEGLDQFTRHPAHIRKVLDALSSPDQKGRSVKVTGSKGKGSTARLIAGFLESQGFHVGLFTSPHLIDFTERIRVDGKAISEPDFMRLLEQSRPHFDAIQSTFLPHEYFGPVGVTAVVASLYFAEMGTDFNVIELGRGARYDDVNALAGEVAVITPVHLEHVRYLGPHIEDIADHKAGIIKAGLKATVLGRQSVAAQAVFVREAQSQGVPLYSLMREFAVDSSVLGQELMMCSIHTPMGRYDDIRLGMVGRHQAENAAVALTAAELLLGHPLEQGAVQSVAPHLHLPGRGQLLRRMPSVLIDGAINRESATYLAEQVRTLVASKVIIVVGIPSDKDYPGALEVLATVADGFVMTAAQNPHLTFPIDAVAVAQRWRPAWGCKMFAEAIEIAIRLLDGYSDGLIVIAGTQSLVAEALSYYSASTRDLSFC